MPRTDNSPRPSVGHGQNKTTLPKGKDSSAMLEQVDSDVKTGRVPIVNTASAHDSTTSDDEWITGDFKVVTSDNVVFMVPSYYLFASSPVFRDALSLPSGGDTSPSPNITLLDPGFETASVFRLYLRLVHQGRITFEKHLPHVKELFLFLRKWDCEPAFNTLSAHLEIAVRRKEVYGSDAFLAAAHQDDVNLCQLILTVMWDETWRHIDAHPGRQTMRPGCNKDKESVWNPHHWEASMWASGIPQRYLFALACSYGETIYHLTDLPDKFRKYLDLIATGES